jgi:hypothetical protein
MCIASPPTRHDTTEDAKNRKHVLSVLGDGVGPVGRTFERKHERERLSLVWSKAFGNNQTGRRWGLVWPHLLNRLQKRLDGELVALARLGQGLTDVRWSMCEKKVTAVGDGSK